MNYKKGFITYTKYKNEKHNYYLHKDKEKQQQRFTRVVENIAID